MPEAPFGRRLAHPHTDSGDARRAADQALALAAAYGAGWLMPMGFEFGARREMDPARDRPEDFARLVAEAPFDLTTQIAATNACCGSSGARTIGSMRVLSPPGAPVAALLLAGAGGETEAGLRLILVNESLDDSVRALAAPLLTASGLPGAVFEGAGGPPIGPDGVIVIAPGEVRVLRAAAIPAVVESGARGNGGYDRAADRDRGGPPFGRRRPLSGQAAGR